MGQTAEGWMAELGIIILSLGSPFLPCSYGHAGFVIGGEGSQLSGMRGIWKSNRCLHGKTRSYLGQAYLLCLPLWQFFYKRASAETNTDALSRGNYYFVLEAWVGSCIVFFAEHIHLTMHLKSRYL